MGKKMGPEEGAAQWARAMALRVYLGGNGKYLQCSGRNLTGSEFCFRKIA